MTRNGSDSLSGVAGKRHSRTVDNRVLERSETVFWTLAPPGILLHNFARRCFLELDAVGYKAWAFLDGARTVDEVVARCCKNTSDLRTQRSLARAVTGLVTTLVEYGFVEERKHD